MSFDRDSRHAASASRAFSNSVCCIRVWPHCRTHGLLLYRHAFTGIISVPITATGSAFGINYPVRQVQLRVRYRMLVLNRLNDHYKVL